ncbi:hypothetical protein HDE_04091 [Halotydeus destructor]|nr:hypothetical protein HDE_04091 [Halotydeus destructor]
MSSRDVLCLLFCFLFITCDCLSLTRLKPGKAGYGRGLLRTPVGRGRGLVSRLSSSLSPAKLESRQDPGLIAGGMAIGLVTLPFLLFPLLMLAPIAYARMAPLVHNLNEAMKQIEEPSSPLNDLLNAFGFGNGTSPSTSMVKFSQALGLPVAGSPATSSSAVASALGEAIFSPGVFSGASNAFTYKRKPSNIIDVPSNLIDTGSSSGTEKEKVADIAKGVFRTLSNGIRRYELDNSGCRERLICELNQKVVGSGSVKSWMSAFMDVLESDGHLKKLFSQENNTKGNFLKDVFEGTKRSFSNRDCAELFPNCSSRRL